MKLGIFYHLTEKQKCHLTTYKPKITKFIVLLISIETRTLLWMLETIQFFSIFTSIWAHITLIENFCNHGLEFWLLEFTGVQSKHWTNRKFVLKIYPVYTIYELWYVENSCKKKDMNLSIDKTQYTHTHSLTHRNTNNNNSWCQLLICLFNLHVIVGKNSKTKQRTKNYWNQCK